MIVLIIEVTYKKNNPRAGIRTLTLYNLKAICLTICWAETVIFSQTSSDIPLEIVT
uniref:Uncharacterized protein n=1 Tax=Schistosoma curassoni TaxID=6186 RepID=A0A183KSU8_9TREM